MPVDKYDFMLMVSEILESSKTKEQVDGRAKEMIKFIEHQSMVIKNTETYDKED